MWGRWDAWGSEGIIITSHGKLAHYLGMLTHQVWGDVWKVSDVWGRWGGWGGEGIIITSHDKLAHYLGMLTQQVGVRDVWEV